MNLQKDSFPNIFLNITKRQCVHFLKDKLLVQNELTFLGSFLVYAHHVSGWLTSPAPNMAKI